MKREFIHNEIWTLTFGAAFQRAYVYSDGVENDKKEEFKTSLRTFIENEIDPQYNEPINDMIHISNINSLSEHSRQFQQLLRPGQLNFGISQKLLNLHLKYLWCLEVIPTPPHFPVDRRIQEITGFTPIKNWTEFTDELDYLRIINHVRKRARTNQSIAEYELENFERRLKTK